MPEFRYTARNQEGLKVMAVVNAATEAEAVTSVTSGGLFLLEIGPVLAASVTEKIGRISAPRMASFYSQLADLLHGGVPLLRSLHILQEQSSQGNLKIVLEKICRRVEEGEMLSEAMQRFPTIFGEMAIQMIRAGIEGGFLEEALLHVAHFTETQGDLKSRVTGALAYPLMLAVFMTVTVIVILTYFLPKFEDFFVDLKEKGDLPLLTQILMGLSKSMQTIIPIVIPLLLIAVFMTYRWSKTEKGRRFFDHWKLRLPLVGKLLEGFAVARFCRVLGTLLKNGVPILRSLDISADATGNRIIGDTIHAASGSISEGQRLAVPLANSNAFPKTVVEMISVAEESNTLDTVLIGIADSLEKRNWRQLDLAVRFLEPMMLMALGGVVLILVIGIMTPIFKMSMMATS
ncbi:MAG: type II secretion system F family protein [Planctomycetaceae bacterium]|jgi:general secretion pathway protein F/type IV pilus assembly protein PilC|nr:type II secretion system F family protein [Planctomycetaceae bacterium]